jgi:hypothetical protein
MTDLQRRGLNVDEKRVLLHVLRGWEGGTPYLQQLPTIQVTGRCGCGCVTVYMQTPDSEEEEPAQPLPVEATLVSDSGDPVGGVLIFESNGKLTTLEAYSFHDDPSLSWPPNDRIQVESPAEGR